MTTLPAAQSSSEAEDAVDVRPVDANLDVADDPLQHGGVRCP
jgi:hypothetical protein